MTLNKRTTICNFKFISEPCIFGPRPAFVLGSPSSHAEFISASRLLSLSGYTLNKQLKTEALRKINTLRVTGVGISGWRRISYFEFFCHSELVSESHLLVLCTPFLAEGEHLFQDLKLVTLNLFQSLICFAFWLYFDKRIKNETLNKGISGWREIEIEVRGKCVPSILRPWINTFQGDGTKMSSWYLVLSGHFR